MNLPLLGQGAGGGQVYATCPPSPLLKRKDNMNEDEFRYGVFIPVREFLYTLDQIAYMLDTSEATVNSYVYFTGRDHGRPGSKMRAVNLAGPEDAPIWRVSESSLIAWLQAKGIPFHEQRVPAGFGMKRRVNPAPVKARVKMEQDRVV